jgi:hypothetical protein
MRAMMFTLSGKCVHPLLPHGCNLCAMFACDSQARGWPEGGLCFQTFHTTMYQNC